MCNILGIFVALLVFADVLPHCGWLHHKFITFIHKSFNQFHLSRRPIISFIVHLNKPTFTDHWGIIHFIRYYRLVFPTHLLLIYWNSYLQTMSCLLQHRPVEKCGVDNHPSGRLTHLVITHHESSVLLTHILITTSLLLAIVVWGLIPF